MMVSLEKKHCVPCEGGVRPFTPHQYRLLLKQVPGWKVVAGKRLERDFKLKNFKEALRFVNRVGRIAERENHHPDAYLHNWNKVNLILYTHAIGGLSENDFIVAAKINRILI